MTTTADIITTGTTTTNDETTTKLSFAKRLCDSLERDSEMRAISDDPDNDYLGDMSHMLDMHDDACDALIRRAVYFTLQLASLDAICDLAVVVLRESYLAGYREYPKTDVAVACAYADVLTSEIDARIANDFLAYAPMSDISDTLDTIDEMVSAEASDDDEEIVSLIQSILRDEHVKLTESRKFHINDDETIDDTDEDYDELLRIGHLTVDDLLKGIPDGKGDKINIASALVTGGLVCDPNGRVYLEAFEPTAGTSNYPSRVADAIVDNRMEILTNAFEILDLAADHRTVQLTRDLYATILSFNEVPEDIWVPYVHAWQDNPGDPRWARHERRWAAIMGAYDKLHDEYVATHGAPSGDDSEDEAPAEPALDEYLIATGGWLLVEDEVTEDKWYVNTLDLFGFDDARNVYDAGETWARPYYALRKHGMTAA